MNSWLGSILKTSALVGACMTMSAATAPAQASEPTFAGHWNVTFYLEPSKSLGATQCIVATHVAGTVAGVPESGTWTSPTFSGWAGQWVQLGDHIRWFGLTGTGLATEESGNQEASGKVGGVSFNHFSTSNAATSSAGSWVAVRSTCGAGSALPHGSDPSQ